MLEFRSHLLQRLMIGIVPLGVIALCASPSLAQASIPGASTVCAYDPDGGMPNPLGMRSFITAGEVGSDTVFVYEQFSSPVLNENDSSIQTDITSRRTLTIYSKPIDEARQILADSPKSYAALLGLEEAPSEDFGFTTVNDTLVCQELTDDMSAPTPAPEAQTPPATTAPTEPQTTFADLSNGNYRVTSATYPLGVVSDEELVENGGTLFLFRKFGEEVTGRFSYIDSDIVACVAGKIEDNQVVGEAYTDDDGFYQEESTAVFFGPGGYLLLEENEGRPRRTGERSYGSATLNLEGFSRINAGTVLPPESCP